MVQRTQSLAALTVPGLRQVLDVESTRDSDDEEEDLGLFFTEDVPSSPR